MSDKIIHVLISDDYIDKFSEVVQESEKVGLKVVQQLKALGVVIGSIDPDRIKKLKQVKGVSSVEEPKEVSVPPLESDIQ
jgi:hypothetical protein